MPTFSERHGHGRAEDDIQIDQMDESLRNQLWNTFATMWFNEYYRTDIFGSQAWPVRVLPILSHLWDRILARRVDDLPGDYNGARTAFYGAFRGAPWFTVYDLVEATAQLVPEGQREYFTATCNRALRQQRAGLRFIGWQIGPLVTEEERAEVQAAAQSPVETAREHIKKALALFANRENPDYANAIKEAISAVEAVARDIAGEHGATLGQLIPKLAASGVDLGEKLREALRQWWQHASDLSGARHALKPGHPAITQDDARFMLVTCSAWVNLLVAKKEKSGGKT